MPCRLKKRCYTCGRNLVPHPLVDPGNSPHRHEARTTAHPTRPRHRMVALAACPPGRGATRPPQKQNATVMLGCDLAQIDATCARAVKKPVPVRLVENAPCHEIVIQGAE